MNMGHRDIRRRSGRGGAEAHSERESVYDRHPRHRHHIHNGLDREYRRHNYDRNYRSYREREEPHYARSNLQYNVHRRMRNLGLMY